MSLPQCVMVYKEAMSEIKKINKRLADSEVRIPELERRRKLLERKAYNVQLQIETMSFS